MKTNVVSDEIWSIIRETQKKYKRNAKRHKRNAKRHKRNAEKT